jgi:hypothetical protein
MKNLRGTKVPSHVVAERLTTKLQAKRPTPTKKSRTTATTTTRAATTATTNFKFGKT